MKNVFNLKEKSNFNSYSVSPTLLFHSYYTSYELLKVLTKIFLLHIHLNKMIMKKVKTELNNSKKEEKNCKASTLPESLQGYTIHDYYKSCTYLNSELFNLKKN